MNKEVQKWDPDKATAPIKLDPYSFSKVNAILQEIHDEPPGDERTTIETLRNLHVIGRKAWYLMGDLLLAQKERLKARHNNFLEGQLSGKIPATKKYNDPITLAEWMEKNKDAIPFSMKTAQRYMNARICTDIAEQLVIKLGAAKVEILQRAGKNAPVLMQRAAEEGWTKDKCDKEVERAGKVLRRERALTTAQKHGELPRISVKLDGNKIVIETDKKYTDQLNGIILSNAEEWKKKLYLENKIISD